MATAETPKKHGRLGKWPQQKHRRDTGPEWEIGAERPGENPDVWQFHPAVRATRVAINAFLAERRRGFGVFPVGVRLAWQPDMIWPALEHAELTGRIIEGFHETFHELGSGFSERVSQAALAIVLTDAGLDVRVEVPLSVMFRGRIIGDFHADMVVNDTVLVEIKVAQTLEGYPQAQLLNYLKAAGGGVGLLVNFGRHPAHKRMVMGDPANSLPLLRTR